jgi:hypothetical protein
MLRAGKLENTLNVSLRQRASVALVGATGLAASAGLWLRWLWLAVAALSLVVTLLNWDFYRFFIRERGVWFAARTAPLHWLYFVICGLSVALGTLAHYLGRRTPTPAPEPALSKAA